jgi:hypothetical protein
MPKMKRVEIEGWILWSLKGNLMPNQRLFRSVEELIAAVSTEHITWEELETHGYRALPATVVVEVPDE